MLGYVYADLWYKSAVFISVWLPENKFDVENSYFLLPDWKHEKNLKGWLIN